jgi:pimeloyl-ACP methyl ester carboxylesterase
MATEPKRQLGDYILPLYMNGLQGRMLRLPSPPRKKREILLIYGHHSSLERMFGFADLLNRYGGVTVPDLPGFGGMEPFYNLDEKPTLDNLADYLAAFVKMRYHNRRVTMVGMSFGFIVITRMLQRYPELAKKTDIVFSFVGFANRADFKFKRRNYLLLRFGGSLLSRRLPAAIVQHILLRGPIIKFCYFIGEKVIGFQEKFRDADPLERAMRIKFEIGLWRANDIRTYGNTAVTMFTLNQGSKRVNLPVYHVSVKGDRYFDNNRVQESLCAIYTDCIMYTTVMPNHAPSVVATAEEAKPYLPKDMHKLLNKRP